MTSSLEQSGGGVSCSRPASTRSQIFLQSLITAQISFMFRHYQTASLKHVKEMSKKCNLNVKIKAKTHTHL